MAKIKNHFHDELELRRAIEDGECPPAVEKLIAARSRIEKGWCQGTHARDAGGGWTPHGSRHATSWCIAGALHAVGAPRELFELFRASLGGIAVSTWNDAPERTKADVLAAFDRAIELAREPELVA